MSRKAICLLDKEPEIKGFVEQLEAKNKQAEEEIEFLKKKAKQVADRIKEEKKAIWKALHVLCEARGLLPEGFKYDNDDHNMGFDLDSGVLYCEMHKAGDCDCPIHRSLGGGGGEGVFIGSGKLPPELGAIFSSLFGRKPSNGEDSPTKGD